MKVKFNEYWFISDQSGTCFHVNVFKKKSKDVADNYYRYHGQKRFSNYSDDIAKMINNDLKPTDTEGLTEEFQSLSLFFDGEVISTAATDRDQRCYSICQTDLSKWTWMAVWCTRMICRKWQVSSMCTCHFATEERLRTRATNTWYRCFVVSACAGTGKCEDSGCFFTLFQFQHVDITERRYCVLINRVHQYLIVKKARCRLGFTLCMVNWNQRNVHE